MSPVVLKCWAGLTRCRLSVSPVVLKCWAGLTRCRLSVSPAVLKCWAGLTRCRRSVSPADLNILCISSKTEHYLYPLFASIIEIDTCLCEEKEKKRKLFDCVFV